MQCTVDSILVTLTSGSQRLAESLSTFFLFASFTAGMGKRPCGLVKPSPKFHLVCGKRFKK